MCVYVCALEVIMGMGFPMKMGIRLQLGNGNEWE